MPETVLAYIGLGSNIEPEKNIPAALQLLGEEVTIKAVSSFYRTPAIDRPEDPDFYNGVAAIMTDRSARTLKFGILRAIESQLGRQRTQDTYAPRTIDLDLLLYDSLVCDDPGFRLPDGDIERPFVGLALLELDSELIMPGTHQPLASLFSDRRGYNLQIAEAFTQQVKRSIGL